MREAGIGTADWSEAPDWAGLTDDAKYIVKSTLEDASVGLDDGCIVIEDVLDAGQVADLTAELAPHFDEVPNCAGDFYGYVTKRLSGLIGKSRACQSMAINSSILGVMDHFLLKGCREYQLNLTQAIQIGPGEPAQVIHRDDLMFNFAHPEFEAMINTMWAVDDFTAENGATHVVPGSHKWPLDRQAQPHEETAAPNATAMSDLLAGAST